MIDHTNSAIGVARILDASGEDHVLVRLTRIGDLNLDGAVTIADFIALAAHFNQDGTWQEGDVNYDGAVTIADFIALASNFNQSYSGQVLPIDPHDQLLLNEFAAANVPEPLTHLLLVPLALVARRRRVGAAHRE